MKNKILAFIVTSTLSVTVSSAVAADGKINFTGAITDDACTVTNNVSNPLTVALGTVSSKAFSAAGDTASPTKFTIALTDCPASINSATVKFDGKSNDANNSILALTDDTGVATGVGIQLSDANNNIIPLYTSSASYNLTQGDNNLEFVARYYATAASVTAGPANSTSNFTIVYN